MRKLSDFFFYFNELSKAIKQINALSIGEKELDDFNSEAELMAYVDAISFSITN